MKQIISLLNRTAKTELAEDAAPEAVETALQTLLADYGILKNRFAEADKQAKEARVKFILDQFTPAVFANREQAEAMLVKDEANFLAFAALTPKGGEVATKISDNLKNCDYAMSNSAANSPYSADKADGEAHGASMTANEASREAEKHGNADSPVAQAAHKAAADAHEKAAEAHKTAGNERQADFHSALADFHGKHAGAEVENRDGKKPIKRPVLQNRDKADASKATLPKLGKDGKVVDVEIKNAEGKDEAVMIRNRADELKREFPGKSTDWRWERATRDIKSKLATASK